MGFTLEQVVPWGRNLDEYTRMFGLTPDDFEQRILGCCDGPASFNAEATRRGHHIVSFDPLYGFPEHQIRDRMDRTFTRVMAELEANRNSYWWTDFPAPEAVGAARMAAMELFLQDYDQGKAAGRYVEAALPALPAQNNSFDLALVSHFLFLYSDLLPLGFHCKALLELCRVAREVRVFPIINLDATPSPHLEGAMDFLQNRGIKTDLVQVPYEFQKGANTMLRVRSTGPATQGSGT